MSEETQKDSISMLKMAQEVHDRMIENAREEKDKMVWEAEKIIRAAEESVKSRLDEVEKETSNLVAEAKTKAEKIERDAVEKAALFTAQSRNEHDNIRKEIESLQRFESEYRDKLSYLVLTAAQTLEFSVDEGEVLHEDGIKKTATIMSYEVAKNEDDHVVEESFNSDSYGTNDNSINEENISVTEDVDVEVKPLDNFENEGGAIKDVMEEEIKEERLEVTENDKNSKTIGEILSDD